MSIDEALSSCEAVSVAHWRRAGWSCECFGKVCAFAYPSPGPPMPHLLKKKREREEQAGKMEGIKNRYNEVANGGPLKDRPDGSTDGDYSNHDAEVTIYLGWNIL